MTVHILHTDLKHSEQFKKHKQQAVLLQSKHLINCSFANNCGGFCAFSPQIEHFVIITFEFESIFVSSRNLLDP